MSRFVLRRVLESLVLVLLITIFTFFLIHSAPGGPSILLDPSMSPEDMARLSAAYGLDQPVLVQYFRWLGRLFQGDLGFSLGLGRPVAELVMGALPATLLLSGAALLLALVIAIPAGIIAAIRRDTLLDQIVTGASFFGLSLPVFWYGLILIVIFAVTLNWLPAGGMNTPGDNSFLDTLRHLILPAITLATVNMAQLVRYTRSAMLSVLKQDYIRTARAKGIRESRVINAHAFRTALVPVVTLLGMLIPRLVGGAAITESVFSWPGLGRLAISAASRQDYPTIMGITLLISIIVIVMNLIVDLLYSRLDPRVSYR